jgi:SAM-dependent methyltransferase
VTVLVSDSMRNSDRWSPTKYVMRRGRLRAARDQGELGIGSRLIADVVAARYDKYLPNYDRGRLVDLGCGKVPLFARYRDLVSDVTCVDWPASKGAHAFADVLADLAEPLPFADSSFDTIVLSDVLEHVPNPELLWREMARVLAPGGHALVNVPFLYPVHESPHDYGRYTVHALQRFADQAGLQVPVMEAVGGSMHVLVDLLAKHLARVPILGAPIALTLQAAVRMLDATAAGRRFTTLSAQRFPLGYFMVASRGIGGPLR